MIVDLTENTLTRIGKTKISLWTSQMSILSSVIYTFWKKLKFACHGTMKPLVTGIQTIPSSLSRSRPHPLAFLWSTSDPDHHILSK